MQYISDAECRAMVKAFKAAENLARVSLGKGKEFLGAYGVADALGYERNGPEWNCAVSAAYSVFKDETIVVNSFGIQV